MPEARLTVARLSTLQQHIHNYILFARIRNQVLRITTGPGPWQRNSYGISLLSTGLDPTNLDRLVIGRGGLVATAYAPTLCF